MMRRFVGALGLVGVVAVASVTLIDLPAMVSVVVRTAPVVLADAV
jgi:hypothetical protein